MKTWVAGFAISLWTLWGGVALAEPSAAAKVALNIERQPVRAALKELSDQAGVQVLMRVDNISVDGVMAPKVSGEWTVGEALKRILDGTGLGFEFVGEKTVRIAPLSGSEGTPAASAMDGSDATGIRFAQSDAATASSGSAESAENSPDVQLDEIVVTAQKRIERLQDVPVPVTAISAEKLVESNQLLLRDYYTSIPGLSLTPATQSAQVLSIRGIATGGGNPTTGVTIDDVPYGGSIAFGGGFIVPDIDPSDLTRVEVLRGPQGTLYGANSMGGLIKFVTIDPSTDSISGRLQAGTSSVYNGDGLGYSMRGAVNVPLSDAFAVRASAFTRRDPGYIDDPVRGVDGVNSANADGGRLSVLWRPADTLSIKLSALLQKIEGDGTSDTHALPGLGDLQQSTVRGTGWYDRKAQAYSATLAAKLGLGELTALSGYNINQEADAQDYSYGLAFFGPGGTIFNRNKNSKLTQELRYSMPIGSRVDWLLAGFYTDEDSAYTQGLSLLDPATGAEAVDLGIASAPTRFKEYAAFTDLTFHVTNRLDVQFGGRQSRIRQTQSGTSTLFGGSSITPEIVTRAEPFTYLVTPRLKLSPDLMIYARLASGYRAGGPNTAVSLGTSFPRQYDPDKTQNYEVGVKGDFLERTLSLDASLYYIDWKNIQVFLLTPDGLLGYTANTSRAKSQGIELSIESRPLQGLTISGWVVWNDAELTEDFPPTRDAFGASGDRLPFSSRFSGNISLSQEFPLTDSVTGFLGGTVSYVGDRKGVFMPALVQRQALPAYAKTDLRVGVRYDTWTVNLFANNVTDRRGLLTGGVGSFPPYSFQYIQPRTVGLSLGKEF